MRDLVNIKYPEQVLLGQRLRDYSSEILQVAIVWDREGIHVTNDPTNSTAWGDVLCNRGNSMHWDQLTAKLIPDYKSAIFGIESSVIPVFFTVLSRYSDMICQITDVYEISDMVSEVSEPLISLIDPETIREQIQVLVDRSAAFVQQTLAMYNEDLARANVAFKSADRIHRLEEEVERSTARIARIQERIKKLRAGEGSWEDE